MSVHWLSQEINRQSFSRIQRLSWFHYVFAVFAAYLLPWLDMFLLSMYWRLRTGVIYDRYHQGEDDSVVPTLVVTTIVAVINFLILLPFLRFPVRRRIAYFCLCVGWLVVFWNLQAAR